LPILSRLGCEVKGPAQAKLGRDPFRVGMDAKTRPPGGWPTLEKCLVSPASPNRGCPILARSVRKGGDRDNMGA